MSKPDARWDRGAESRLMAEKDGWCMVRRPGAAPYVIFAKDWHKLPSAEDGRRLSDQYEAILASPSQGVTDAV